MNNLVRTSRSDVVWSYIGTIVSMASGFVLLPLLMVFLSDEELGLWYVYVAVANLATLFEFGFNPTFARNIVFVVSGARRLAAEGRDASSVGEGVDWHLLNVVIRASKLVFACIAVVVLAALALGGSAYIAYVSEGMDASVVWPSWIVFCVAIFLNLYFYYATTILRGYGDIAGENQAKTFSRLLQIAFSAAMLLLGTGLVGASVGYLVSALSMRMFALIRMRKHGKIERGRKSDTKEVGKAEVRDALAVIGHVAWRDGVVQLSNYASSQGMSIMCSLFLGLAETGTYSILLQFGTAIYHFASAYPKSFYPSMQAAFVEGDVSRQRHLASSGIVAYWFLYAFGVLGVCVAILPLLPLFKPGIAVDYPLFLGICLYLGLWSQHGIFCNYIISMNEIPYLVAYLASAVLGLGFVYALCGILGWGAWGIVAGQALCQVLYNNWKWPRYFCGKLGTTYPALLRDGCAYWKRRLFSTTRDACGGRTGRSK